MGGSRITPAVGWFWCAGVMVVGAGAPFDVGEWVRYVLCCSR